LSAKEEVASGPEDGKSILYAVKRTVLKTLLAIQTRYMEMLLQQDIIPRRYNILVAVFTWLQLTSYVFFPGIFRSLRNFRAIESLTNDSAITTAIYDLV
jgi:hypothetical protein